MTDKDALSLLQRKYDYLRGHNAAQDTQIKRQIFDLITAQAHRRSDTRTLAKNARDIEALGAKIAELVEEKRTLKSALRAETDDHAATMAEACQWVSAEDRLPDASVRVLVRLEGHQEHSSVRWYRDAVDLIAHWQPGSEHADDQGWPLRELERLAEKHSADELKVVLWCTIPCLPSQPELEGDAL